MSALAKSFTVIRSFYTARMSHKGGNRLEVNQLGRARACRSYTKTGDIRELERRSGSSFVNVNHQFKPARVRLEPAKGSICKRSLVVQLWPVAYAVASMVTASN